MPDTDEHRDLQTDDLLWWQKGVVYQVYPRSFLDSTGDGVGDLPGITQRLDYLAWLGVDAVWVSPFYPSPMADFGYDVSNYTDVHPMFGTLDDFDCLVAEAHARGLRVILDWVPNHTSQEHPWFLESRSSRTNPRRDWYIWRDPSPSGGPPTNWLGFFGGSAWELDEATGQYYYHAFLPEQPDLNWRNPDVQSAMLDTLRFWLDRDVDGFRVDVIYHLLKDDQFRDNPLNPDYKVGDRPYTQHLPIHSADLPDVQAVVSMIRKVVDEYPQRVLIAELYLPLERIVAYYGVDGSGAHLPFNFRLIFTPWDAQQIGALVDQYEGLLPPGGQPNWVLGNHDKSRIATRVGPAQARVAAMLLTTLKGTPTMYYGDEIGMHDVRIPPELLQDPVARSLPGLGLDRDPQRTPMQWGAGANAGFTNGTPWLPIADDFAQINVEDQREDPASLLTFYRSLIQLRRDEPALHAGTYERAPAAGDVLAYLRAGVGRGFLVALNLGSQPQPFEHGRLEAEARVTLSTLPDRSLGPTAGPITLAPNEGVILELR